MFRTRTKPAAAVPPFRGGIQGGAAAVGFGYAVKAACFGCRLGRYFFLCLKRCKFFMMSRALLYTSLLHKNIEKTTKKQ